MRGGKLAVFMIRSPALAVFFLATSLSAATITVTTTADDVTAGDGTVSLREAITAINAGATADPDIIAQTPGTFGTGDTIDFGIAGAGVHTIKLGSELPIVTKPVVIDGTTQPGALPNTLGSGDNAVIDVVIDGQGVVGTAFVLDATSTVRGLSMIRFSGVALFIDTASNCAITGNFIGVMPDGTTAAAVNTGIFLTGTPGLPSGTRIGGSTPDARNIIVANGFSVDLLSGDSTVIAGNLLGTDRTGTAAIGGSSTIQVYAATNPPTNTTIGGTSGTTPGGVCSGACNVVAGTVAIFAPTATIQGNFIGIDRTGTTAFGTSTRIAVSSSANPGSVTIGGTSPNARNVVSGSKWYAIAVENFHGTVTIEGNYIGTNSAGTSVVANGAAGIMALQTDHLQIGGTAAGAGNVIGGSAMVSLQGSPGITIEDGAAAVIQGNLIGVGADGTTPIPNTGDGIDVGLSSAGHVVIGPTVTGGAGGNVIANNGGSGVVVGNDTGVSILSNSIYNNAVLGIDLGGDGVTPNDPCDPDLGPNNLQNYPVLTAAAPFAGQTAIAVSLNSKANTTFTVEFFTDPTSATAQGKTLIGSTTATTSASCGVAFVVTVPLVAAGTRITATATDPAGSTSEFSAPIVAGALPTITKSFSPSSVPATVPSTLTVTLANSNAVPLTGAGFTDTYPAGLVNASATTSTTCGGTVTAVQGGGTLTLTGGTIPANGTCSVTVSVSAGTSGSYTNTIPASAVTSASGSPAAGASATLTVTNAVPLLSPSALLLLALALAATAVAALRR